MNSVVATLVAMVIFFTVFAARAPAMGNSADRAWQLSQLMEGVSTACNPNHGSLSCVQARRCVSKQIGWHDAACQGCPRCVVLAIQLFGSVFPPSNFSKEHQKERCDHSRSQRSFITFSWCASEYSVVGRISRRSSMITPEQTFFNDAFE